MRGHVFESDDIAALPTEESSTLLSLERQSPDAEVQNVDGRWRQLANPVSESLFGAARVGTSAAVLVGVNGTIVRVDLATSLLKPVEKPKAETLAEPADGRASCGARGGND